MKKITAIFTLAIILLGSCRKEIQTNQVNVSKLATTAAASTTPSISNAAIANWFVKNPMGAHLSVDWKKARQATVNGVAVVTVPLKNITLNAAQPTGTKQASDLSSSTNATLTTFDPYHPPALYFFQDKNSAYPDSVHSILMNFVPDDPTKEDGANKIWTGKLAEWNMQSSTAYYQHLTKSMVDSKNAINLNQTSQGVNSSTTKVNSVGTSSAKTKVSSLLSDIWESIVGFFNFLGWELGIPGSVNDYSTYPTVVTNWCAFLGGIFCGGGSDSGSDGSGNGYTIVYSSYVMGYSGYDAAQGTNWTLYTGGSGGSDGTACTTAVKGKTLQQASPVDGCGSSTIFVTSAMVVNALCVTYSLTTDQQIWLNANLGFFDAFTDYINNNPDLSEDYYAAVDFLNFSIGYCMSNAMPVDEFVNIYATIPEGIDGPDAYDDSYWSDPNLQIPQQALPSYQAFHDAYPADKDVEAMYTLVGGQILANHNNDPRDYANACALRVSWALNHSGVTIPPVKGTQVGQDGKNYFLNAKTLNVWMNKTFGPPTYHFTKAQLGPNGENFPTLANGVKGIYSMIASNWNGISGHADLYFGTNCARGCDITPKTDYIDIWVLP